MRKQDLKVGEEYAAGSTSRFDKWRRARVRVEELDGQRVVKEWSGERMRRGIVVTLVEDCDSYGVRGKAGDVKVFESAREIVSLWAPYAERKAAYEAGQASAAAERRRVNGVATEAEMELSRRGIDVRHSKGVFRVPAETMAQIVALLP